MLIFNLFELFSFRFLIVNSNFGMVSRAYRFYFVHLQLTQSANRICIKKLLVAMDFAVLFMDGESNSNSFWNVLLHTVIFSTSSKHQFYVLYVRRKCYISTNSRYSNIFSIWNQIRRVTHALHSSHHILYAVVLWHTTSVKSN